MFKELAVVGSLKQLQTMNPLEEEKNHSSPTQMCVIDDIFRPVLDGSMCSCPSAEF
jgi:hypothetical protein